MPKVTITQGPDSGKSYDIERAAILGRLESNDIPVHDKKASREHAKIYRQGQTVAIVDLNSSNGTYVDGRHFIRDTMILWLEDQSLMLGTVKTGATHAFRLTHQRIADTAPALH